MSRFTIALIGAVALGSVSLISEPASALPISGLSSTSETGSAVEQVRYFHRGYRGGGFGFRRGYGYRPYGYRYGYRRPGPIRRLINHL